MNEKNRRKTKNGFPKTAGRILGLKSKTYPELFAPNHPPQLDCCIHVYVVQRPVNDLHKMPVTGTGDPSLSITMNNSSSDSYTTGHPMNTPDSESIDSFLQY